MRQMEDFRVRVKQDIDHARGVVIPGLTNAMSLLRHEAPELPEHDRIGLFVAELRRKSGTLEMAIVIGVLIENLVDRQKAS